MAPFGCAGHCSVTGAALQCSCAGRETASHSLCPSTPALSLSPAGRSGLSLPGPGRRICPRLYAGLEPSFALSQRLFPAAGREEGLRSAHCCSKDLNACSRLLRHPPSSPMDSGALLWGAFAAGKHRSSVAAL